MAEVQFTGVRALVTGANRGLGLEISRRLGLLGMTVVLAARSGYEARDAADRLKQAGVDAHSTILDVTDAKTVAVTARLLDSQFGGLDVLINNAGIMVDSSVPPSELDLAALRETFETNVFGAFAVIRAVLPMIRASRFGRIVNMSSSLGSMTLIGDRHSPYDGAVSPAYQASKAALNAITVLFAKELRDTGIKVNAACPGWVRTALGSDRAPLSVEEGADTPVWLATLPDDGPSGGFFNQRKPVPW
ncbi:MAG: SDR family oxidoreductase [Rhodospirillales bacterium]|nr:MAG: SDR family oxidoreductase [Rhodospirillales bacterium]